MLAIIPNICYKIQVAFLQPLYRGIVQLVEYRSPKPQVVGSNPTAPVIADLRSRNVDGGFFVCRVVAPPSALSPGPAPPHKSFPKVQKIRNITGTSGQAINNICRGAFLWKNIVTILKKM